MLVYRFPSAVYALLPVQTRTYRSLYAIRLQTSPEDLGSALSDSDLSFYMVLLTRSLAQSARPPHRIFRWLCSLDSLQYKFKILQAFRPSFPHPGALYELVSDPAELE
jgi:hypothetical protein